MSQSVLQLRGHLLRFDVDLRDPGMENMRLTAMRLTVSSVGLAAMLAAASSANAYDVKEVGSFHTGGRQVSLEGLPVKDVVFSAGLAPMKVDPNGDFQTEQMYVQYVKLRRRRRAIPLLLWHGGGLTGVTWETKPDGKPGWQTFFLRAGHDVYVSDAVERGRASWARYPEVFKSEPLFRTKKEAWEAFRIGPAGSYNAMPRAAKRTCPASSSRSTAFDQFVNAGRAALVDQRRADAGGLQRARAEGLPVRDRGAQPGRQFRLQRGARRARQGEGPDRRRAVGRARSRRTPTRQLKDVPHLFVWGDYIGQADLARLTSSRHERLRRSAGETRRPPSIVDLPKAGIKGNTHMLMMDTNSDVVAARVQAWLVKSKLMK